MKLPSFTKYKKGAGSEKQCGLRRGNFGGQQLVKIFDRCGIAGGQEQSEAGAMLKAVQSVLVRNRQHA